MGIHAKSIEKIVSKALKSTPADEINIYQLIKMNAEEVAERSQRSAEFREQFDEAQALIALALNAKNSTQDLIQRCKEKIAEAEEQANEQRRRYVAAVREIRTREGRLEQLRQTQEIFSSENIGELLREYRFVKKNPVIADVQIVQEAVPRMVVTPQPLVIEYQGNSYWLENLAFSVELDTLRVVWEAFRQPGQPLHNGQIHPHISSSGQICWGDASTLIDSARENRDVAGLVKIITDWLTLYNANSPYVRIDAFPPAPAGSRPGWQQPEEN